MPIKFYLKGALKKERLELLKNQNPKAAKDYLKKPKPLILSVSNRGNRFQIPLGISIPPYCWDGNKIKDVIGAGELTDYNKDINDVENKVRDFIKSNSIINKGDLIKLIRNKTCEIKKDNVVAELDYIKLFEENLSKMTVKKGFPLSDGTKKKFISTLNHLKDFISEKNKSTLLKALNQEYFEEFKEFLYEKNLNNNTVPKYLKGFNIFLKDAVKRGSPSNIKAFEYYSSEYEPPVFIVELEEIVQLINFKFDEYLERVRDLFVFMCFTGQRISEIKRISWSTITTSNSLTVWITTTKKTSETIHVPIPDYAKDILNKYAGRNKPLPVMSDQHFNRKLKRMAEVAGLNRMILKQNKIKNEVFEEMVPLHTKIKSHIARKSFITNALILGMSEREVKTVSAHKDDRSFRRYVQLAEHVQKKAKILLSKENIENYLRLNKQLADC